MDVLVHVVMRLDVLHISKVAGTFLTYIIPLFPEGIYLECISEGRSLHPIPACLMAGLTHPANPLARCTYISADGNKVPAINQIIKIKISYLSKFSTIVK